MCASSMPVFPDGLQVCCHCDGRNDPARPPNRQQDRGNGIIDIIGQPEPGSRRPFSRATCANGFVFVSGHSAPHDPAHGIHRGATPAEQVREALALIRSILSDAGASFDGIVQITMLIQDPADYDALNAEYVRHFPNGLPARHTARFGVPTDAKVAFACIALAGPADGV